MRGTLSSGRPTTDRPIADSARSWLWLRCDLTGVRGAHRQRPERHARLSWQVSELSTPPDAQFPGLAPQGVRGSPMKATSKQHLSDARPKALSYKGSLWQDGAGWISASPPDSDLPSIELAVQNNHYCHTLQSSGSHCDPKKEQACRQLSVASAICLVFMTGEVIGGYLAHSLVLTTDAAHSLTDCQHAHQPLSLFLSVDVPPPDIKTLNFSWQGNEILGALFSVLSIWVRTGVLAYLAVECLTLGIMRWRGGPC